MKRRSNSRLRLGLTGLTTMGCTKLYPEILQTAIMRVQHGNAVPVHVAMCSAPPPPQTPLAKAVLPPLQLCLQDSQKSENVSVRVWNSFMDAYYSCMTPQSVSGGRLYQLVERLVSKAGDGRTTPPRTPRIRGRVVEPRPRENSTGSSAASGGALSSCDSGDCKVMEMKVFCTCLVEECARVCCLHDW